MAIIKAVSSKASIGKSINYITQDKKTNDKLISGIECSPDTAITEMQTTKEMWNKNTGREYYHFVQSFPSDEVITPKEAHTIALKLAEKRFKGHEVVLATHIDKEHTHTHFIVNSVNHEDGKKLHWKKDELQKMKDMSDDICREHGKSICVKNDQLGIYSSKKYKAFERAMTSDYKGYIHECYEALSEVKGQAINKEDFIDKMRDKGFETNWTDNRKHITFTDIERENHGEKKCKVRNSNLEKTYKESFGKEDLERGFERNYESERTEQQAREQLERVKDVGRGTGTGDTDAIINDINQSIRSSRDAVGIDERQRRDRIAKEESIKREQERAKVERSIRNQSKQTGIER